MNGFLKNGLLVVGGVVLGSMVTQKAIVDTLHSKEIAMRQNWRECQEVLFENRKGTWGDGLVKYPHCDIDDVVISLGEKYDAENPDVSSEIEQLRTLRDIQQQYLDETYEEEKQGLQQAIKLMNDYAK